MKSDPWSAPSNLGKSLNLSTALVSAIDKMKGNTLHFKKLFSG